jgi:hypothetical protein
VQRDPHAGGTGGGRYLWVTEAQASRSNLILNPAAPDESSALPSCQGELKKWF